jgi:hypothetical protein
VADGAKKELSLVAQHVTVQLWQVAEGLVTLVTAVSFILVIPTTINYSTPVPVFHSTVLIRTKRQYGMFFIIFIILTDKFSLRLSKIDKTDLAE